MVAAAEIKPPKEMKQLAANLKKLTRNLNDWRPVWNQLLPTMIGTVDRHFKSGGTSTGQMWPPSKNPGKATMILTGDLVKNMTSRANVGLELKRKTCAIFPTVGRYPFMMQFGAKRAGRNGRTSYPARPFLVWTDSSTKKAEDLSEDFVNAQITKVQKGLESL